MKFSGSSPRKLTAALFVSFAGLTIAADAAGADNSIFENVESSVRDRMFFRLSYIHANVKSTSGNAYDVTGPVFRRGDIEALPVNSKFEVGEVGSEDDLSAYYITFRNSLNNAMNADNAGCPGVGQALGTPCGIKSKSAAAVGSVGMSLGYYIDQDRHWALEALLLGAPVNVSVYGDGNNGLRGKEIIKLKMLPPIATIGRYFGSANAPIRPYLGLGASYAMFYDIKPTNTLNLYQGGKTASDTKISVKNAFSLGPFLGAKGQLNDDWHVALTIGSFRFKTEATLTTHNTTITSGTGVLQDYGPNVAQAITAIEKLNTTIPLNVRVKPGETVGGYSGGQSVGVTTALMCEVARNRLGNNDCNFGSYVRKQRTTMDALLFSFSVGRSF